MRDATDNPQSGDLAQASSPAILALSRRQTESLNDRLSQTPTPRQCGNSPAGEDARATLCRRPVFDFREGRAKLAWPLPMDHHYGKIMTERDVDGRTVTAAMRRERNSHAGAVIWLTGLSGSGKTTLADIAERALFEQGRQVWVLDGDSLRRGLCADLGFSPEDRKENVRRAGAVASLFAEAGLICIAALISPYRSERELARRIAPRGRFLEVYLSAPLTVCEKRDPKGLYVRARAGEIKDFTGISAPYEPPGKPDLELRTDLLSAAECTTLLLARINGM